MTDTSETPTGFTKNEPIMASKVVQWFLLNLGAVVVGHTHLVTDAQWNAAATVTAPLLIAGLLSLVGLVERRAVAPAWKLAQLRLAAVGFDFPDLPPELAPPAPAQVEAAQVEDDAVLKALVPAGTAHSGLR